MGSIEVLERKLNTLKRQESLSEEKIVEKREEIAERQIIKDRAQIIDIIKMYRDSRSARQKSKKSKISEHTPRKRKIAHFWFHLVLKLKKRKSIVTCAYCGSVIRLFYLVNRQDFYMSDF